MSKMRVLLPLTAAGVMVLTVDASQLSAPAGQVAASASRLGEHESPVCSYTAAPVRCSGEQRMAQRAGSDGQASERDAEWLRAASCQGVVQCVAVGVNVACNPQTCSSTKFCRGTVLL